MENSKNDHSLGKKLLHGFQFLLNNTWLFYILIALALFIAIALRMHQAGISLFPKQTNISVKSPYYQAGMTYWEELDYVSAEEQLLLALKETQETNGTSSLETAEVMQKLGALYLEMDKIDECYDYLNSAYVTFLEKLGPSDGMTTIAKCQICLYDIATDNVERGLAGLTDAYDATKDMSQKMQIAQLLAHTQVLAIIVKLDSIIKYCSGLAANLEPLVSISQLYGTITALCCLTKVKPRRLSQLSSKLSHSGVVPQPQRSRN